jgi:hypothetical protein
VSDPDGCTFWIDGWWRACCDAHDMAYIAGNVDLATHLELGRCVIATGGGLAMGALMSLAATLWWLVKHRGRKNPHNHKDTSP